MMAKKDRFPPGYSATFAPHYESEGSGSSGRIDSTEDSCAPMRKWIDLNSASRDGFAVPIQIIPVSKLSSFERKSLVLRLTSELDQIRLLQNKVESQKKKPVNAVAKSSSSDILSCNNAQQKGLQVGNVKKPSGLGTGPGKKGRGWNRGITGRFESANQNTRVNANAGLLKQCESLLKKLMSQQYAWVFNTPVDVVKLDIPDYFDVIKNPMDLGTIKSKLTSGKYSSPLEFLADVRLTFTNAKTYNPPGTDVHIMADTLSQFFELRWKAIEKKLPLAPSKKRKLSPRLHEAMQEPIKRKMTDEEKYKLSSELEDFLGDLPDSIIDLLRAQTSNRGDGGEDEIEIDIDDLSDDTLFTLRKLLDDHSQEKQKNLAKSEACEIEDVDVGGNEAPVTSYPPVLIDKDIGGRAEECNEASEQSGSLSRKNGKKQGRIEERLNFYDSFFVLFTGFCIIGKLEMVNLAVLNICHSSSRQVSPDKQYRAALLKNRFADTILKAREKTLSQDDKADPDKLRREREELEMHKKREKARLQAEARAAEDARRQAEAEAAAEARRRRELEREAAREALLKMEKTVEINENSRFLEDLEMLRAAPTEQLPSSVDESSPDNSQDGFGNFNFGGSNPLEQLGLYMKVDEEEEEGEPPSIPNVMDDVEEGEID
ncbi:hypothetical protein Pfo_030282 [Paulownia fortunei]|nr:hypothetical protein Pfo_030282 [Paulownia fortunei]